MSEGEDKAYRSLLNSAMHILGRRPYGVNELRTKLLKRDGVTQASADRVVARLIELQLLDDSAFIRAYSRHRLRGRPLGRHKLRAELIRKKLSKDLIEEMLEEVYEEQSESDLIDAAIAKQVRIKGFPADRAAQSKLYNHLMRRGFPSSLIRDKLFALPDPADEE